MPNYVPPINVAPINVAPINVAPMINVQNLAPGSDEEFDYVFDKLHAGMALFRRLSQEQVEGIVPQCSANAWLGTFMCDISLIQTLDEVSASLSEIADIALAAEDRRDARLCNFVDMWTEDAEQMLNLGIKFTKRHGIAYCVLHRE